MEEIFFEDYSKHFRQVMCRNGLSFIFFVTDNFKIPSLRYICVKTHNVHRNKKCSVFHIYLFSERYDFCDFDIGCSSVSTNFVKHRTRFYWIIKETKHLCFNKGVGHGISNHALGVGQSFFCRRKGVGHVFFINHISKCSGPHRSATM